MTEQVLVNLTNDVFGVQASVFGLVFSARGETAGDRCEGCVNCSSNFNWVGAGSSGGALNYAFPVVEAQKVCWTVEVSNVQLLNLGVISRCHLMLLCRSFDHE